MPRTKSAPKTKGPRSYVSELHLSLGPINTVGRLVPLRKADDTKFIGVCPDCNEPTKPDQRYICPNDNRHVHPMSELARAKELDGALYFVDREELDAARSSELPLNVLRLTAHPKPQVWDKVWDAGNAYVFQPRLLDEWYALLVRLVSESNKTFIGVCNLRNNEGLFRLNVWQGNVIVEKIVWPNECNAFDSTESEEACDDAMYEAAVTMLTRVEQPFDPDSYRSTVKDRLTAIGTVGDGVVPIAREAGTPVAKENILAALEAFGN